MTIQNSRLHYIFKCFECTLTAFNASLTVLHLNHLFMWPSVILEVSSSPFSHLTSKPKFHVQEKTPGSCFSEFVLFDLTW